ncbi:MAG: LacI family DNA-binding transcriptional regulator [Aggregatilineales bacterium]
MATLEDVAKRARVSVSTASRILSERGRWDQRFRQETRERVLQASRELGYTPNLAARALVSGRSNIIATVFPRVYDNPFSAMSYLQVLGGIEAACHRHKYHLLITSPDMISGHTTDNYLHLVQSGYLDGMILRDEFTFYSVLQPVVAAGIPAVVLGHRPHPYYVRSDDYSGGYQAMAHALELGHRRIGIIAMHDGEHYTVDRCVAGMLAAAAEAGLPPTAIQRAFASFSSESAGEGARRLLESDRRPTVILCMNDLGAYGVIEQALKHGLRVPSDLSVIGYDDLPHSRDRWPRLTSVNQSVDQWGLAAVDMLMALMAGHTPEPVTMPARLVIRESTAPPPFVEDP